MIWSCKVIANRGVARVRVKNLRFKMGLVGLNFFQWSFAVEFGCDFSVFIFIYVVLSCGKNFVKFRVDSV